MCNTRVGGGYTCSLLLERACKRWREGAAEKGAVKKINSLFKKGKKGRKKRKEGEGWKRNGRKEGKEIKGHLPYFSSVWKQPSYTACYKNYAVFQIPISNFYLSSF